MYQLKVILATTREGRKGPAVADWFMELVKKETEFQAELLDLKAVGLPFLDEPEHPRLRHYRHQHTKRWSSIIDSADAFVFITCEYNYGMPATLKNALDFVYQEWNYKPAGIVSYGGISGGIRATQMLKLVLTAEKMMPMAEAVHIPFFAKRIDEAGVFHGDETLDQSAHVMMQELLKWTPALKEMRKDTKR
jgi:NAD(P)H-dependent FMN reductase